MLRVLDLFSGIGGFSLGLERTGGFVTAAFCEIEKYPVSQLKKNFPGVPIYDDIKTLTAERLVSDGIGRIDVITGGYPCQPFSVAGKQKGEKDDRHLWPSMLEIIAQVRPTYVICENVTGHIALGLDQVLLDLETEGYASRTFIVPAASVNAPHRRDRLWIVAHSNGKHERPRQKPEQSTGDTPRECSSDSSKDVADSDSARLEQSNETLARGSSKQSDSGSIQPGENALADSLGSKLKGGSEEQILRKPNVQSEPGRSSQNLREIWAVEPSVGRVADGIPGRVARLKALGNAVVPQIPMMIGQAILDYEQNQKV
jgi:DNA (cytosine-5)-methyltransferase 1